MSAETIAMASPGTEGYVLGNEAVARGAIESGVWFVACYPGTPSSEISDTLCKLSGEFGYEFEYSANEIVATEAAAGVALFGGKSMVIFKGAGFFVASDALFHLVLGRLCGPMVIVACDDPSMHSSSDEVDLRMLAQAGSIITLVPSNVTDAKEMTIEAFKLSELMRVPVLIRMSTRLCHQRGFIKLGDIPKRRDNRMDWDLLKGKWERFVPMGGDPVRGEMLKSIEVIRRTKNIFEDNKLNKLVRAKSDIGILTCGVTYGYSQEAIKLLDIEASMLNVGTIYPLPEKLLKEFIQELKTLIVVEELRPYLESYIRALAKDVKPDLQIFGKWNGYFPQAFEYDTTIVMNSISKAMNINVPMEYKEIEKRTDFVKEFTFPRDPVFCPGCPHRATFYAVKKVTKDKAIITQDVGCYSIGLTPPFKMGDIVLCMGGSIGVACGISYFNDRPIIGFIGDSTFFHAGLPGLINAVHNQADFTLIILDNGTTGMTGFQPHPGNDSRGRERLAKKIDIENIVKAIGVEDIKVVDSYNIKELMDATSDAIAFRGVSVIISRRACSIISRRENQRKGLKVVAYQIDSNKCEGCWLCIEKFGCPAIERDGEVVKILSESCNGCSVCAQICPFNAIFKEDTNGQI
ncbi:MAG: 4Fe-4S binding protein [Syntrophaceae bacterium]|nr:4Fe-4S binding protein [Syntrophaceae bacterium]